MTNRFLGGIVFSQGFMNILTVHKNNKYRQVSVLYMSYVFGVLVGVLNSVINTRSLDPDLYGDYRYVQNIISFVSSLLLVGFFTSGSRLLALSKDEAHSKRIRGAMCAILGVTYVILMIVMSILFIIALYKGNTNLSSVYLVSIPLCGNVLLLNYINTTAQGDNQINRIALASLLPPFLYCLIAFFAYQFISVSPALMLALFNGSSVIVLTSIIISTKPSFKNIKDSFHLLNTENKKYGFNVYLGSLMGVSTQYVAGIELGNFCATNADVGFYTLSLTIAHPLATLPTTIGTTFFKSFAENARISKNVLYGSFAITILSFVFFSLIIKYIVGFLYNDSYSCVSVYSVYLAAAACVNGLGDLFNRFLGAHGQGRQIRNGAFACGLVMLIGCFSLIQILGVYGAIATKVLSSLTYFVCMFMYYLVFIKKNGDLNEN